MPVLALVLVLSAAFAHATWNYLAKGARNDFAFQLGATAVASVAYLPAAVIALLVAGDGVSWKGAGFVAVSSTFQVAYFFMLGQGYKRGDLSLIYPLARGTGPTLAVVGAIVIYGERPGPVALLGSALVVLGIVVMSWSGELRSRREAGAAIGFALATGACTATYTLWDKRGIDTLTPVAYGWGLEAARALWLLPFVLSSRAARASLGHAFAEQRRAVLGVGLLSPGAYMLVLAALSLAPVSYVSPAREVSILIGALLGLRLLGESHPRRRIAGAAAIVAGIVALALG